MRSLFCFSVAISFSIKLQVYFSVYVMEGAITKLAKGIAFYCCVSAIALQIETSIRACPGKFTLISRILIHSMATLTSLRHLYTQIAVDNLTVSKKSYLNYFIKRLIICLIEYNSNAI